MYAVTQDKMYNEKEQEELNNAYGEIVDDALASGLARRDAKLFEVKYSSPARGDILD
jgi:hypothetical protein